MDRIREAVTRARSANPKLAERLAAEPRPRFHREPAPDTEQFQQVSCNFDGFAKYRIISNEQDPVLAAYRVLRTRVLQKMEAEGWRTLAVVSPASGAGKTVTAINLAIAAGSKRGSRATLVDLDFYRPSVAKYLGLAEVPSVLDYFEGKRALREVVLRPDLPDMLLIANERVTRRGAEHLTSARADELIARCVEEFRSRIVIFDISPLLGCDDAIAFLPKVDCVLVVAASGETRTRDLKEARRLLGDKPIVGSVLNKARLFAASNYYY
ncbi:MAG: XrtA-associated tyrosine autokinase [Amphiplicatus sp.]